MTSSRAADRTEQLEIDLFEGFCANALTLENGKPFVLEPFQREMLEPMFGGAVETLILLPKKNGKTTLLAAVALYHLCTTPDAECVIVAAARHQAGIMLRQAQGFIRRSPWLQDRLLVKQRELVHRTLGGRVQILASDVDTVDGVIPTLALVDELHRHKNSELSGVLSDGLGPRDGRMVTISTAGASTGSPLGVLRRKAHELPTFRREGYRNVATSADGSFVMHEWCMSADEDRDDMGVVARANPASWQTPEALAQRRWSPSTTPWQWARFACGVWTEGEQPWIDPRAWDRLAGDLGTPEGRVWLGVDLGVRHDSTAIAVVWRRQERLAVRVKIMEPGANGVQIADVEDKIRDLCGELEVDSVVYDPWSFRRSSEMLEAEGLPMVEYPMSPERMSAASATLYGLIESKELAHDGDPALRSHVLAGVTKETERGWRLVKDPRLKRPIDALIAVAIACQVAASDDGGPVAFVEVVR